MLNDSIDNVRIDINSPLSKAIIYTRLDDTKTRTLHFSLTNKTKPISLENCIFAEIMMKKPDGYINDQAMVVIGNEIQYTLRTQDVNVAGDVRCQIRLTYDDASVLTTPEFIIEVYDRVFEKGEIESTNEYTALVEITAKANEYRDIAIASATQAQISEANAKESELNASLSEGNAKESEVNAKESEVNAKESEVNAKESELNALASETNAKESEVNAKASEIVAKSSEEIALEFKNDAHTSMVNAKESEDNAKVSEDNSKSSETNSLTLMEQTRQIMESGKDAIREALGNIMPRCWVNLDDGHLYYEGGQFTLRVIDGHLYYELGGL